MFHFVEYFVRKSIRNGISLILISTFLIYLGSGSLVHNLSIPIFLFAAVCWIYFGFKFKKQLNSVDEPTNHEAESDYLKFFKFFDSILSGVVLIILVILFLRDPFANAIYYLVSIISILFVLRIYQIVIISKYLKNEVRN